MTYCWVTKPEESGSLQLAGEGFTMNMDYDPETLLPELEFIEVTDSRLQQYWPDGVTRIVLTLKGMKRIGDSEKRLTKQNE